MKELKQVFIVLNFAVWLSLFILPILGYELNSDSLSFAISYLGLTLTLAYLLK